MDELFEPRYSIDKDGNTVFSEPLEKSSDAFLDTKLLSVNDILKAGYSQDDRVYISKKRLIELAQSKLSR